MLLPIIAANGEPIDALDGPVVDFDPVALTANLRFYDLATGQIFSGATVLDELRNESYGGYLFPVPVRAVFLQFKALYADKQWSAVFVLEDNPGVTDPEGYRLQAHNVSTTFNAFPPA